MEAGDEGLLESEEFMTTEGLRGRHGPSIIMSKLHLIVEGDGSALALPVLVREKF